MNIYNQDCIAGSKEHLSSESIDLMVCDPPFGIGEGSFDNLYARKKNVVLEGYVEAPTDYAKFSKEWLTEAKRVLKPNGSIYIISGWTNLVHILNVLNELKMPLINHLIWKYNFGCNTSRKFVTSHYHVLYATKSSTSKPKFNTYCRYGQHERDENGSNLYRDMEDVFKIDDAFYEENQSVWEIKKEYQPGEKKNKNKLPDALIQKIIQYSSDPGDLVCDFFLGNFTTAYVATSLGRRSCGFELNSDSFNHHIQCISEMKFGEELKQLKVVENIRPINQGKPLTPEEELNIVKRFEEIRSEGKTKKASIAIVCEEFGRGRFGILNILSRNHNSSRP